MSQTVRTFVAIETPPELQAAVGGLIERLSSAGADVRWVKPHNVHLTLKFLGDVALTDTARICQAVARAANEVQPFEVDVAGAGAFPNLARPRTVWLGVGDPAGALGALHKQVERRLEKLGFRRESRAFRAHLTLGRVRRAGPELAALARRLREHAEVALGRLAVGELVVFSSHLASEGPTYSPLGRASLGG